PTPSALKHGMHCVAPVIRSVTLECPLSYSTPRLLLHTKLVTKKVLHHPRLSRSQAGLLDRGTEQNAEAVQSLAAGGLKTQNISPDASIPLS
ncbi:hypothetical protein STEG23_022148, partial [Scotinomys teguina]